MVRSSHPIAAVEIAALCGLLGFAQPARAHVPPPAPQAATVIAPAQCGTGETAAAPKKKKGLGFGGVLKAARSAGLGNALPGGLGGRGGQIAGAVANTAIEAGAAAATAREADAARQAVSTGC